MKNESKRKKLISEEIIGIDSIFDPIYILQKTHPKWFHKLEHRGNLFSDRKYLIELINTAPNEAAKFWLLGKYSIREELLETIKFEEALRAKIRKFAAPVPNTSSQFGN